MKLKNNSKRNYVHSYLDENASLTMLVLKPGEVKDIPDDVAKTWLKGRDVVEYVDPNQARIEKEKLEAENAKLKAELEAQKKEEKKETKPKKTSKKK